MWIKRWSKTLKEKNLAPQVCCNPIFGANHVFQLFQPITSNSLLVCSWWFFGKSYKVSWCQPALQPLSAMVKIRYLRSVQPLDVIMEERICGPLKMRDTGFKVSKDRTSGWGFPSGCLGVQDTQHLPRTHIISRWWFQIFSVFTPTWGNDPIWLMFFKWFETTT